MVASPFQAGFTGKPTDPQTIYHHTQTAIALVSRDGTLAQANPAFCRYLDYSPEEMGSTPFFELVHPEDKERVKDLFLSKALDGTPGTIPVRYRHKNGSTLWGQTNLTWITGWTETEPHGILTIQDVTHDKKELESLREQGDIYKILVENIDVGIALVDAHHKVVMVNAARARMVGKPAASMQTKHCFRALEQGSTICEDCPGSRAMSTGKAQTQIREFVSSEGQPIIIRLQALPVFNAKGQADHFIEICEDITPRIEAEQRLLENQEKVEFLTHYDPVTYLPNRFLLFDRLTQVIHKVQRSGAKAFVIVVGLQRFERVNKTLGHDASDQVLAEVSRRLQGCVRSYDTVARTGSSEFALVLENIRDFQSASSASKKILEIFRQPIKIDGQDLYMGGSIGISQYPDDGNAPDLLLKAAEVALSKAITEPGGNYRYYTADLDTRAQELLQMESCLAKATENRELLLYYQPQFDLKTQQLIGVEALLRWQRPNHGLVSPGDFIPLAESSGLILAMGDWVLKEACRQAVAWAKQGLPPLLMAVNISPRQFHQANLAQKIVDILLETGMDPAWLEVEITESTIMNDLDKAIRTMEEIHSLGVRLAIDDFGTGYSSLGRSSQAFPHSQAQGRSDLCAQPG